MRDSAIRQALESHLVLRNAGDPSALIRHELGVCQGARRVDVAVINGHLDGWEIKSDEDTLRRLEGQAEVYSKVLDRAWLVATERHLVKAVGVVPDWWGVVLVSEDAGGVRLRQMRRPRMSPVLEPMAIAQLLWRDEALGILRDLGQAQGLSGRARWYVWERLAESLSLRELRQTVRCTLRARQVWPGDQRRP